MKDRVLSGREPLAAIPVRLTSESSPRLLLGPARIATAAVLAAALIAGAQLTVSRVHEEGSSIASTAAAVDLRIAPEPGQPVSSALSGTVRCPFGQIPTLHIAYPPPGDAPGAGAANAEAAFRTRYPTLTSFTMYPFGSDRPSSGPADLGRGPVWIVVGADTYIALAPGVGGGNDWFVYPATFVGCRAKSLVPPRTWLTPSSP